jgi:hypothetical protein
MTEQFDAIKNPKHYSILDGVESIQIIASAMTVDEWRGFCLGNIIKYRLRAGNKDKLEQDIGKADYYKELFEKHKHMCRGCADKPVINIEVGGPVPPGAE